MPHHSDFKKNRHDVRSSPRFSAKPLMVSLLKNSCASLAFGKPTADIIFTLCAPTGFRRKPEALRSKAAAPPKAEAHLCFSFSQNPAAVGFAEGKELVRGLVQLQCAAHEAASMANSHAGLTTLSSVGRHLSFGRGVRATIFSNKIFKAGYFSIRSAGYAASFLFWPLKRTLKKRQSASNTL